MNLKTAIKELLLLLLLLPASCMEWEYGLQESFNTSNSPEGLFITNEGNFQYGNATLSYYNPTTKEVENEVFYRANAMKLGDIAQSMVIRDGIGWVVVNNSHVVFAIDINTFNYTAFKSYHNGAIAVGDNIEYHTFIEKIKNNQPYRHYQSKKHPNAADRIIEQSKHKPNKAKPSCYNIRKGF